MRKFTWVLFLIIPTLLVFCFLIIPLALSILPTFNADRLGLGNYIDFFKDPFNQTIFLRSLRLSLIATVICVIVGLPTAYWISLLGPNKKRILNSLILFPLLTNAVVRGFAWISILGRNGILNTMLRSMGLIDQPLQLLYTEGAIVVGSVYLFLPTMLSTLSSVMDKIGGETVEASYSLGATPTVTFFKVIVPLSFSGVLVAGVMVFAGTISAYTTPSLLGGNQNMMLATLLYQESNTLANWDAASLISLVMILCSVGVMKLFDFIASRLDKRGSAYV